MKIMKKIKKQRRRKKKKRKILKQRRFPSLKLCLKEKYHDAPQRGKQMPKRRRNRGKAAQEVDFNYQRRIDTFLERKKVVEDGNPTPIKRKKEEEKEKDIGMLITPKKRMDVQ